MLIDFLSLMPYLFTLLVFFSGGCLFTLLILFSLFWFGVGRFYHASAVSSVPDVRQAYQAGGSIKNAGMAAKRELDAIDNQVRLHNQQLRLNNRVPADVYPPNRIRVKCHSCGKGIARGEGYSHHSVGVRGYLCHECHSSKGLPLREIEQDGQVSAGEQG